MEGNVNGKGNKGRKLSEKHKQKIGKGNKGKIISEEAKQKQSSSMKGKNKGNIPWNKGLKTGQRKTK